MIPLTVLPKAVHELGDELDRLDASMFGGDAAKLATAKRSTAARMRAAARRAEDERIREHYSDKSRYVRRVLSMLGIDPTKISNFVGQVLVYTDWPEDPSRWPEFIEHAKRKHETYHQAALANEDVKAFIAEGEWSAEYVWRDTPINLEFEEGIVVGSLAECINAGAGKNWGKLIGIKPLQPTDGVLPRNNRYTERSRYNRRFLQRKALKKRLGKDYAKLVVRAMGFSKARFLEVVTEEQKARIKARLDLEPGDFWRAAKGSLILDLPKPPQQLEMFN